MLGLKRHKKQEGWAIDIADPKDERKSLGTLQRIADNNKLWVACLIAVVILAAFLIVQSKDTGPSLLDSDLQPGYSGKGSYDDDEHTKFAQEFAVSKSYGDFITSARFTNQERFEVIVGRGVSADEIDYAARMAAEIILKKFRQRIVVEVYDEDSAGKNFLASTAWNPEKGYIVKFNKARFDQE